MVVAKTPLLSTREKINSCGLGFIIYHNNGGKLFMLLKSLLLENREWILLIYDIAIGHKVIL